MRLENLKPQTKLKSAPAKYKIDTASRGELIALCQRMRLAMDDMQDKIAAYESEYAVLVSELMQQVMTTEEKRTLAELLNKVNARLRDS